MFELLTRIHDGLTDVAARLAGVGLICIVTFYVFEVITRYFFDSPTSWVSDFVSYALCASVFLALPKVTQARGHVAVTVLVDILPARIAGYVHTFISLVGFACLSFAAVVSLQENIRQYSKGIETLATVPVAQWWISGFITFGLAMSAVHMLRNAAPQKRVNTSLLSAGDS